ncbi:unnamed protein product [Rotaria magnacalcarata]|uniref:BTB domain-containing protein n=1 Tax=Rotaria magnacalcarata TaxID=392030 RepID=A0A815BAV2_9BILA|nr:unnamed protein product [Rotaria magnacalcarata]CAF1667714.1 unnamed protein product [Rotaria magnacalcarata]CAF2153536.1 unnamed protein product [Rotaria magnacalcarata]CAF3945791.1 unnamed protein product [Rotaria magnacalcarata]CAF3978612.1 unnamed protein product [Rotaria magnacalcarata]
MFISIQTICTCHGYLLFESLHCERCRSLIPFQLTDESLLDPVATNNITNAISVDNQGKPPPGMLVPYRQQQQKSTTTGRVRFRVLCPFCNSSTFIIRYYCKRERLYYHLRIQNRGENEQNIYKSIADTQNLISIDEYGIKRDQSENSPIDTAEDSYSLRSSTSRSAPTTVIYDQNGISNAREKQVENERNLYGFNELEGDLFSVLRNGLFYDTLIQCQDDVKLQVHRCILGGRSSWFRHLLGEYHDSNTNDDYVLQISIDDISSEVMNEILNFIYTNRCLISLKNAPDLLIAAKRFELEKLKSQIADFLLYRLTIDNAIEMLISAHEAGSDALKTACIHLINRNAEKIKRTEKWKTFKSQYTDLIPELYENRVENPTPVPQAFLPDVFTPQAFPSDSIRALSQLYENPIQQRIATPRGGLRPPRSRQNIPPHLLKSIELVQPNEYATDMPTGSYTQRIPNSTRRPSPQNARTMLPNIRQNSEVDVYRRPVNLFEPSQTIPTNNQRTFYTNAPRRGALRKVGSPRHPINPLRSPPIDNTQADDDLTLTRVVSIEPAD